MNQDVTAILVTLTPPSGLPAVTAGTQPPGTQPLFRA
ncbi:hypothetical protein SALBM135S_02296 [Streptomyces alboniger]